MLITICYSVLTWVQSRHRSELFRWIQDSISQGYSILIVIGDNPRNNLLDGEIRPSSCTPFSGSESYSGCSSAYSTPKRLPSSPLGHALKKSSSFDSEVLLLSSPLCHNCNRIYSRKVLWSEGNSKGLALLPRQLLQLHDWTGFPTGSCTGGATTFEVLLESEPGALLREQYRKFSSFGEVKAWRWSLDTFAIILSAELEALTELMHSFRSGQIILEGGWRVFRLTSISTEGVVGTIINHKTTVPLTPGELRRLSTITCSTYIYRPLVLPPSVGAGIFERVANQGSSKSITTIEEEGAAGGDKRPVNWGDRSPRKRSLAPIPEKISTPRRASLCAGILGRKSSSLVSLVKQSFSEEKETFAPSQSHESLNRLGSPTATPTPLGGGEQYQQQQPPPQPQPTMNKPNNQLTRSCSSKPPNILILCNEEGKSGKINGLLKKLLPPDRYAIYDIQWDQLDVGGWADQTALLILSGTIPGQEGTARLLQFLGDGGRVLGWCCGSPPFAPVHHPPSILEEGRKNGVVLEHGGKATPPLPIARVWKTFQKVVETQDGEGISRLFTATPLVRVKGEEGGIVVVQWDGGALGGKALLSQVEFEKCGGDEPPLLLSQLLANLQIDCSQIERLDYSRGYLLGDYMRVEGFLGSLPSLSIRQGHLSLDFIRRGGSGVESSCASHSRLPVHILECPKDFSTLDYYNNLETRDLGRIVLYADVLGSTMNPVSGTTLAHGLVVIAKRQLGGRGRGSNVWLSPEGSALFTLQLLIPLDSVIGRRLSLVQHLAALSVVLSVPTHREINLCVKWPNDIYAGNQKIGGVLVECKVEGKVAILNVGIGINVNNAYPTVSLNALLFPEKKGGKGKKGSWSTEKTIAKCLTEFERLLDLVDKGDEGLGEVIQLYEGNWIHKLCGEESIVRVEREKGTFLPCRMAGIDEFGFLRVVEVATGNLLSVRPDGNSFDIANRLIAIKE